MQEEDKDPVYLYFESMMTCARVREYNSNPPPQIHMFLTKKETKEFEHLVSIMAWRVIRGVFLVFLFFPVLPLRFYSNAL